MCWRVVGLVAQETHVVFSKVSKLFGSFRAVDDLSLEVAKGSFTTLLGPSGCGKTTSLRMLAGFYEPDTGDIVVGGRSQRGLPPYRRNVSIVFQDYALFPHMDVLANVSYGLKLQRLSRQDRVKRAGRILEFLGLTALQNRYPHELSGGQQQRVALGRSIVMEPDVLLMDEPLSNLDAKLRIRVRAELKEIQRALGITTIYVTHDQDEALSLSDQVAVMSDGRLQQFGDPWTVYYEPLNRFVADFVGFANFIPAIVKGGSGTHLEVDLSGNTLRCRIPGGLEGAYAPGEEVTVMVRPEWFDVALGEVPNAVAADIGASFGAKVKASSFLGSHAQVWVEVPGLEEQLVVDMPVHSRAALADDMRVTLGIAHDKVVVLRDGGGDGASAGS